ncbi:hypothetical protein [Bacillus piscicola]|uniref:hypothetical protein n=1 Tax=Bacillus piscicola TaxID=1632684 RepID=UPI001F09C744|nr:hypothetical protein [Bacillus piscicola]
MIITLSPWLFHLLLSITIIILAFLIGGALHFFMKRNETVSKTTERIFALLLALLMAALYVYVTDSFTDRASQGERVISHSGTKTINAQQEVLLPFGEYVVIERLYDFGYIVKDRINNQEFTLTFEIDDSQAFLEEYSTFVEGNGVFVNQARFNFKRAYEKAWKPILLKKWEETDITMKGLSIEKKSMSFENDEE